MSTEDKPVPVNTNLPMSLHPANMSGSAPNLVHAMSGAYRVWSELFETVDRLTHEARGDRPKPPGRKMTEVEAQFYERDVEEWSRKHSVFRAELAKKAMPKIENASKKFLQAIASAQGQIETLEAEIKQKLAPHAPTGTIHTEIRERLGKKPSLDRLQAFVKSGDPVIVSTIVGSHPLLLGIDQKTHDILKEVATKDYAPEEKEQLDAVRRDLDRAEKARVVFLEGVEKLRRGLESPELDIVDKAFKEKIA